MHGDVDRGEVFAVKAGALKQTPGDGGLAVAGTQEGAHDVGAAEHAYGSPSTATGDHRKLPDGLRAMVEKPESAVVQHHHQPAGGRLHLHLFVLGPCVGCCHFLSLFLNELAVDAGAAASRRPGGVTGD